MPSSNPNPSHASTDLLKLGPLLITVQSDRSLDNVSISILDDPNSGNPALKYMHAHCPSIVRAMLSQQLQTVQVAPGSMFKVTDGEPTAVTALQIQLVHGKPMLVGARNGASIIRLGSPTESLSAARLTPRPVETKTSKASSGVYHPLIQAKPQTESALKAFFNDLASHVEFQAHKGPSNGKSAQSNWPRSLLAMVDKYTQQYQEKSVVAGFIPAQLVDLKDKTLVITIETQAPTFLASILLEVMQTGTINGKPMDQMRESLKQILEKIAAGQPIKIGTNALPVAKGDAKLFASLAIARYEFADTSSGTDVGYTDRYRSWGEIVNGLNSPTPLLFEAAFAKFGERLVKDSRTRSNTVDNETERAKTDSAILKAMQLVTGSQFFQNMDPRTKRRTEDDLMTATNQLKNRDPKIDANWFRTEGFKRKR